MDATYGTGGTTYKDYISPKSMEREREAGAGAGVEALGRTDLTQALSMRLERETRQGKQK